MKILTVTTELGPGGAEKVILELAEQFTARGHQNEIVSLMPPPRERKIVDALERASIPVVFLNGVKADPLLPFRLRSIIRSRKPDLIHSHLIHPNILTRLVDICPHVPLVNTIHIAEKRPHKQPFFLLDRMTFPLCDACTAVSNAAARHHERCCGLREETIRVISNGVDPVPPPTPELAVHLQELWGIAGLDACFCLTGRLDRQKGFDLFLDTLGGMARKIPADQQWGFVIMGDGPERVALETQAKTLNLPENVKLHFAGFQPDAASVCAMFDGFIMPSRYEGYGLALAEAMNQGLPVICSPVDSLPELCKRYHGFSAMTQFGAEHADEVLRLLNEALKNREKKPETLLTVSGMVKQYLDLFQSVKR